VQLERSLAPGDVSNEEFTEEISDQHAGMTPLALASALNKLRSVKVSRTYGLIITAIKLVIILTIKLKTANDGVPSNHPDDD